MSTNAVRLTSLLRALVQDARAAEDVLGRAGLPSSSASVLGALSEHGRMRLSRLAQLLGVDPSVASRHVANAHEAGLVVRSPDPLDGRAWLLAVSPHGEQRLAEHRAARAALLDRVLAGWSDTDVDALVAALTRLRDDARAVRGAPPSQPSPTAPSPRRAAAAAPSHPSLETT